MRTLFLAAAIGAITPAAFAQPAYYAPREVLSLEILDISLFHDADEAAAALSAQGWTDGYRVGDAPILVGGIEFQAPIWTREDAELSLARFETLEGEFGIWAIEGSLPAAHDIETRRQSILEGMPVPTSETELGGDEARSYRLRWTSGPMMRMRYSDQEEHIRDVFQQCALDTVQTEITEGCPVEPEQRLNYRIAYMAMMNPALVEITLRPGETSYRATGEILYQVQDMRRLTQAEME